ncbi:MAG: sigma-54 dependent transcriptional regulator [Candidatus Zixiibacteriota bacterium]
MARILIVDDEERIGLLLSETLSDLGHQAAYVTDGTQALAKIRPGAFDLVITDLRMSPVEGMEIVRAVAALGGGTDVAVLTAYGSTASAVTAMRAGAVDYIAKPLDLDEMTLWVERWEKTRRLDARAEQLDADLRALTDDEFIGAAPAVMHLRLLIERVAPADATVVITGESGTGKELVARAIHKASPRAQRAFVATNCASLTETLLESELFGHEKGAFTGAIKQRPGRFELADKGTLFLDEVGEISPGFQAKLLRALEQREIVRVGAAEPIGVDVRVIVATNKDLAAMVAQGRFREDLFFRLNVFPIHVPPLRERREDIAVLAEHFLRKLRYGGPRPSRAVMEKLQSYNWPGNIRELKNVLERAVILAGGEPIGSEHLALLPTLTPPGRDAAKSAVSTASESLPPTPGQGLADVERQMIEEALRTAGGNKSDAARRLKITRRVLYAKLRRYGLDA